LRNRISRLLALAGSTATLLICTSPASAQTENAESKTRLLDGYAKTFGVASTEAERRLRLQREIGLIGAKMKRDPAYAGHYIEHKPVYRVVAKFTGDATAALAKYTQDPLWTPEVAAVPYGELQATQSRLYPILKGLGFESASRIDIPTGEVQFAVLDPVAVQRLVTAGTLAAPDYVKFVKAENLDTRREASVEGGRELLSSTGSCTSGFTIVQTGTTNRFLTTAGHCPGALTYNNMSLPVQGQRWETKYDYQWHTAPGFTRLPNVIYEGFEALLPITAVYDRSWMSIGDWVCKWGSVTGWTCGGISDLDYSAMGYGGFVEVHQPENRNLSDPGDSGAPWYNAYYQEAWGVHSDSSSFRENDAFFMPVSNMRDWGHQVLTSP
jgi:hypothetical protein